MVRADYWPPKMVTVTGNADAMAGDMVKPASLLCMALRVTDKLLSEFASYREIAI